MSRGNLLILVYAVGFPVMLGVLIRVLSVVRRKAILAQVGGASVRQVLPPIVLAIALIVVCAYVVSPTRFRFERTPVLMTRIDASMAEDFQRAESSFAERLASWRARTPSRSAMEEADWQWSAKEGAFPLIPLDAAAADRFVSEQIGRAKKEVERFRLARLDPEDNHCQMRLWDTERGSWIQPMVVFLLTPAAPSPGAVETLAVNGRAMSSSGDLLRATYVSGLDMREGLWGDFVERFLFDYAGTTIWGESIASGRDPGNAPSRRFVLPKDGPIKRAVLARTRHSTLLAKPDGTFELKLDTVDGEVVHRLDLPDADALRPFVDDPYGPPGVGFPIDIDFDPPKDQLQLIVPVYPDRYRWFATTPGEKRWWLWFAIRRVLPESGSSSIDDLSQTIRYETNYGSLPRLDGQMRCKGAVPKVHQVFGALQGRRQ